ncbi:MAG TPA: hypothetical protein VKT70_02850, partial [Stellaceae bacterium]|nr:hypothetical protein [Stellaceae bacterium]
MPGSRRDFLLLLGTSALWPGVAFATAPTDRRLVLVVARGALDGLAALPPLGDPRYREKRGSLAMTVEGGCLPLDGFFALHP